MNSHDERSYDDPASGDAGDTPRTDALIEQWMQSPTPVPPEFIALCRKLEREGYSKQETNAMLAENWSRTERLLGIALKENKALWDGIEAIREKQLEKPKYPADLCPKPVPGLVIDSRGVLVREGDKDDMTKEYEIYKRWTK